MARSLAVKYRAMLHQTGNSRARSYTIGVDCGEILLADKLGTMVDVLNPAEWDLKLDGVDDDYLIFQDLARGQKLVCDINFLDELIATVEHPTLLARAKAIKKDLKSRSPVETSVTALLGVLVLAFTAWLAVGFPMAVNAYKVKLANQPAVISMSRNEREEYVRNVSSLIQQRWKPPVCDEDREAIVRFDVNRNGMPEHVRIVRSSGDGAFDEKAKFCVRSGQYSMLPSGLGDSVALEFNFAYKRPTYGAYP